MKVLQLVDSLEIGGLERMVVNYSNALVKQNIFVTLAVTRKEGVLRNSLDARAGYLFLNRKKTIDFKALLLCVKYVKNNEIDIIHAHGTSFFFACLLKMFRVKSKIIWHDHYGNRSNQSIFDNKLLVLFSFFFTAVFVVNLDLKKWAETKLFCRKVFYIPNFTSLSDDDNDNKTVLNGNDGKRIICLANLRNPKNHIFQLKAFNELELYNFGWTLHWVGKCSDLDYQEELLKYIESNGLQSYVFIYGAKSDIKSVLNQATIAVLSSTYEGFPVVLLEYALAKLPIITTNVGYCSEIVEDNVTGLLFNPDEIDNFKEKLIRLTENKALRDEFSEAIFQSITDNYSEKIIIDNVLKIYFTINNGK